MPLTRISLREGKSPEYHKTLMDQIYLAMHETLATPENDRFATITEHKESCFNTSGNFGGIDRSEDLVIVQVTLLAGRSVDLKKAFYAAVAHRLSKELGLRKEDVFINLVEVAKEDWSVGNGEAQYAS
ncbi:MAG: tautomerase family protein [Rhizobiaceae bacterium]